MPRAPRINFPDAVYHVTSRGNGRAKIFIAAGCVPIAPARSGAVMHGLRALAVYDERFYRPADPVVTE